ncbi:MAG: Gfo/Idh/MocA family oxidoreductase, partial [Armatimonadota bacterium]
PLYRSDTSDQRISTYCQRTQMRVTRSKGFILAHKQGKSYGFGLIGAGMIGKMHAEVVKELSNAHLAAVTALPFEAAQVFAKEYGGCAYASVDELLADPDVDIVTICTPSGLHPQQAIAAAKAGKHVLIEKPIGISLEGADAAIAAAREAGVKLGVISQRRFDLPCKALKQAIDSGEFGQLILVNGFVKYYRESSYYSSSNWRGTWALDGGGALMNQGVHTVDLVRWLGGPVKSVSGYARTLSHDIEVEDTASAAIEFENGALGSIQATTSASPGLYISVEILGDKGSAILKDSDLIYWMTETRDHPPLEEGARTGSGSRDPMAFSAAGHLAQFTDFLQAIQDDRDPIVCGKEGRDTLELVLAVYESSRTGTKTHLPLLKP